MCEFLIRFACFLAGMAAGASGLLLWACFKVSGDADMEVTGDDGQLTVSSD